MKTEKEIIEKLNSLNDQATAVMTAVEEMQEAYSPNNSEILTALIKSQLILNEGKTLAWVLGADNSKINDGLKSAEEMLKKHIRNKK